MVNIVGMIPVLLGSTRIPDKNLIMVKGRLLGSYSIEACRSSGVFTEIYVNSEDKIFEQLADEEKIKFYQRKAEYGGSNCLQKTKSRKCNGVRCVINDHYLYDFMKNISCDYLFQVNSTSPLLKPETITSFVNKLVGDDYDCLFAVKEVKAESFFRDDALNFDRKKKQPSQELEPINTICWAIAGWRCDTFRSVYERDDINESSPVFAGELGTFVVDEREALDIDEWSTLNLVEKYLDSNDITSPKEWTYLDGRKIVES
jgi:CMP-N-acetylneuraminic acid synthetase